MSRNRPSKLSRRVRFALSAIMFTLTGPVSSGLILFNPAAASADSKKSVVQHVPVNVCHATSSDSNPYVFFTVDDDSVKFQGHLMHRTTPNKTWNTAITYNGITHTAGSPKPDLIASYTDSNNVLHVLDGAITEATSCPGASQPTVVLPTPVATVLVSCGKATVNLSNPEPAGEEDVTTAVTLTVKVSGQADRVIVLQPGEADTEDYVFADRSFDGTAHIQVLYGIVTLGAADVHTDCIIGDGVCSVVNTTSTPSAPASWATDLTDTTISAPTYVVGPAGSHGLGSLKFNTPLVSTHQTYFHAASLPLSSVEGLSYKEYVEVGYGAAFQLVLLGANRVDHVSSGFTTLNWEPIYNSVSLTPNTWHTYSSLENGMWWSTRDIAGATGKTPVSLSTIIAANPNAQVVAYSVNQGSGATGSISYVDDVTFDCATTNFEPTPVVTPPGDDDDDTDDGGNTGGSGGGGVLGDNTTVPAVTSAPSVLAASTITELPKTGTTNLPALVIALLGSVVAYELSRRKVGQSSL